MDPMDPMDPWSHRSALAQSGNQVRVPLVLLSQKREEEIHFGLVEPPVSRVMILALEVEDAERAPLSMLVTHFGFIDPIDGRSWPPSLIAGSPTSLRCLRAVGIGLGFEVPLMVDHPILTRESDGWKHLRVFLTGTGDLPKLNLFCVERS